MARSRDPKSRDPQLDLIKGVRRRKKAGTPEFPLTCQTADLLRLNAQAHWRWTHFPAGEYRPPATGARLQRMGLNRGWPDFILVPGLGDLSGIGHFLELKTLGTGELSDEQKDFQDWAWEHGLPYEVARTFERVTAVFTKWRVLRLTVNPQ